MDEQALIRAAEITLRRVILANFPPGPERDSRLEWLAHAVSSRQEAMRALEPLGTAVAPRRRIGRRGFGSWRGYRKRTPAAVIVTRTGMLSVPLARHARLRESVAARGGEASRALPKPLHGLSTGTPAGTP
jgi:hypothetical protein